ncbi:AAA family ATPase [Flavobacterium sp.]|uniref:AAA family ATPase n=1 Tax=Flavobacterium sp. TaxID=239 RepID=UPI0026272AFF|nr:ATP-binding protein [Flavobacterium sp.]
MKHFFVKNLYIHHLRHLDRLIIPINSEKMQHLILTGKNGSGKTSVLNEIKTYIDLLLKVNFPETLNNSTSQLIDSLIEIKSINLVQIKKDFEDNKKEFELGNIKLSDFEKYKNVYTEFLDSEKSSREEIDSLFDIAPFSLMLTTNLNYNDLKKQFESGNYIFAHFSAKRNFITNEVNSPQKIELPEIFESNHSGNELFLQYLVNQQVQLLYAKADNDGKSVKEIEDWFLKIRAIFRDIFEDETLELIYDRDNYEFKFKAKNRIEFDINTLSDGYSSILGIIAELIIRMERKSSKIYKLSGLVLIDELETHLHISLQRKVLRILTTLFPNLQFIVTTHSPFILNSIENAVVYDMEYQETIHDVSKYSTEALVENYFESNKYSEALLEKINHYESLLKKNTNSDDEVDEIIELKKYFDDLPLINSKEMELKINLLNLDYKDKFEKLMQHD